MRGQPVCFHRDQPPTQVSSLCYLGSGYMISCNADSLTWLKLPCMYNIIGCSLYDIIWHHTRLWPTSYDMPVPTLMPAPSPTLPVRTHLRSIGTACTDRGEQCWHWVGLARSHFYHCQQVPQCCSPRCAVPRGAGACCACGCRTKVRQAQRRSPRS